MAMKLFRTFLRDHQRLVAVLLAVALCMKALIPSGYMVDTGRSTISVTICGADAPTRASRAAQALLSDKLATALGLYGLDHHDPKNHGTSDHHATDQSCPYAALGLTALGGADAPLLALALLFAMALAFLPTASVVPGAAGWLRPPLRAPPARP